MLDGITVLSEQTVTENCFWGVLFILIIFSFLFAILLSILAYASSDDERITNFTFFISFILGVVLSIIICSHIQKRTYTEYKVTIDSTVNFLDFEERYIITGKEGQIYTIIDRDDYENMEK